MRLLITGAEGLVGSHLARLGARGKHDVLALGRRDLDVTDGLTAARTCEAFHPDAVLHCAAYTDVDGAEREPERALEVNARGSERIARAADDVGATVIYVSTDYVFDGEAGRPYTEDDVPRPLSSYGRSKLAGEKAVARFARRHTIVRTGWIYGRGKGFVDWLRARLARSERLPLVTDQTGSPTWAEDLAGALLTLAETSRAGVFHFVNRGAMSWLEFGRAVIEELGAGVDSHLIDPVRSGELARLAERPRYSVLSVERFERSTGKTVASCRDALRRYLASTSEG